MRKCALIVDDSKTARQVLAKKLAAFQIDVETADSAANAIDYLYSKTPDAVFMDYEMPGMDGFQALKIIKSNPKTATIPIMMYTSKEGGIALSEARALGAIGVLPKKMETEGLEAIVEQLHLLPHQQSLVQTFHVEEHQYRPQMGGGMEEGVPSNVEYLDNRSQQKADKVEYPEDVYDESVFLLKRQTRIYQKELLGTEKRLTQSFSRRLEEIKDELLSVSPHADEPRRSKTRQGIRYLLMFCLFLLLGYLVWQQTTLRSELVKLAGLPSMRVELSAINDQIGELAASVPAVVAENVEAVPSAEPLAGKNNIEFINWAVNRGTEFEYGENPYNDQRVAWLSEVITQLNNVRFNGILNLQAQYGNFCLSKSETGGLSKAHDDMPFEECVFSVDSKETGFAQSSYQTLGFANYLNSVVSDKSIPIDVFVEADSHDDPLLPYPDNYTVKSAGEWNRIAVKNQRILVNLYQRVDL